MTLRAIHRSNPHASVINGPGRIVGTTSKVGTPNVPFSCRVVLHNQTTLQPVRDVWSSPSGAFTFTGLPVGVPHYMVSFDHTGEYGGESETDLYPELVP